MDKSRPSYPSLFQKPHSIIECECWKSPQQSGQSFHFIDTETGAKENKGFAQYQDNKRWEQGQTPCLFNSQSSVLSLPGVTLFLQSDGMVRALAGRVAERKPEHVGEARSSWKIAGYTEDETNTKQAPGTDRGRLETRQEWGRPIQRVGRTDGSPNPAGRDIEPSCLEAITWDPDSWDSLCHRFQNTVGSPALTWSDQD